MKIEFTETGWTETVTREVTVRRIYRRPVSTVASFLYFNKRHPRIGKIRRTCNCCGRRWQTLPGQSGVYLAETSRGNKTICIKCRRELNAFVKPEKEK